MVGFCACTKSPQRLIHTRRTKHSQRPQERQQHCYHETRYGVVILDKHDYNKKVDEILSDTSKFELLNDDAIKITLKRENQVKSLLKKLKADNCIDERTCNEPYPTGTRIGILYGLTKIHKLSIPLRPILSSVN